MNQIRGKELKLEVVVLLDPNAYKNAIDLYYKLYTIYVGCEERVKIVKLPTEEDLDELRRNQGIDEVIKSLYGARGLTVEDYFIQKLQKPYDTRRTRNAYSDTKHYK
jgi:DNA primase